MTEYKNKNFLYALAKLIAKLIICPVTCMLHKGGFIDWPRPRLGNLGAESSQERNFKKIEPLAHVKCLYKLN